jgi:hypothetical protein
MHQSIFHLGRCAHHQAQEAGVHVSAELSPTTAAAAAPALSWAHPRRAARGRGRHLRGEHCCLKCVVAQRQRTMRWLPRGASCHVSWVMQDARARARAREKLSQQQQQVRRSMRSDEGMRRSACLLCMDMEPAGCMAGEHSHGRYQTCVKLYQALHNGNVYNTPPY